MTDTPDPDRGAPGPGLRVSDDDRAMAAEYVLRLLPDDERVDFERRLAYSRELRDEVHLWEAEFAQIAQAEVQPAATPPQAKASLMRRLFPVASRPLWWQRAGLWQSLTLASLGAVAALGYLLMTEPPGVEPLLVGEVTAQDDSLRLLVLYDGANGTLRLTRTDGVARPGRALELWAIAPDQAPVSLGLLDANAQGQVTLPDDLRALAPGLTLAISDEPAGGSPTGAPTGDVLALGGLTDL